MDKTRGILYLCQSIIDYDERDIYNHLFISASRLFGNDISLTQQLLETPVDQIRQNISSVEQPMKMDGAQLLAWLDSKMEETALYLQPDIDLKTVAETFGLSQRRVIRLLKNQSRYGNFASYLTEKRLEKACSLLKKHPEYTIESICIDAGFSSRRTFQTIFKTRLGMSPSEYRSAVINEQ